MLPNLHMTLGCIQLEWELKAPHISNVRYIACREAVLQQTQRLKVTPSIICLQPLSFYQYLQSTRLAKTPTF